MGSLDRARALIPWWAPKGIEIEVMEHDFKVGGRWKYAMLMPNGSLFISEGTYLEIEAYKKIPKPILN